MSVFDPEVTQEEFRGHWGIPFGRPGGAVDYAQCIFGLITVSLIVPVGSQVMFRTNMSPALNLLLTVDGCWKRVSGNEMSDNVIMVDKQNSKISIKQNDKPIPHAKTYASSFAALIIANSGTMRQGPCHALCGRSPQNTNQWTV